MKKLLFPNVLLNLLCIFGTQALAQDKQKAKPQLTAESSAATATEKKEPIPSTLDEAHLQLEKLLPKEELAKIDAMKTEDEMIQYHFGPGMGMRNSWGLWGGGPLHDHMKKLGFTHADDMSSVILKTFWCKRHGKDFRLKERAEYYAAYWKAADLPPEAATDPADGSALKWFMSFGVPNEDPRMIHVCKSKKTGRLLAYEHDKGVYVPDEALMKLIKEISDENHNSLFPPTSDGKKDKSDSK